MPVNHALTHKHIWANIENEKIILSSTIYPVQEYLFLLYFTNNCIFINIKARYSKNKMTMTN